MFDVFSGYSWGKMFGTLDEKKWLTRIIYLETVAGVPGIFWAFTRVLLLVHNDGTACYDNIMIHTYIQCAHY